MYFVIIYKKIKKIIVLLLTDKCGGGIMKAKEKRAICRLRKGGNDEVKNKKACMVTVSNDAVHQCEPGNDGYGIGRE